MNATTDSVSWNYSWYLGSYVVVTKLKKFVWTVSRLPEISANKPAMCQFNLRFVSRPVPDDTLRSPSSSRRSSIRSSIANLNMNADNLNPLFDEAKDVINLHALVIFKVNLLFCNQLNLSYVQFNFVLVSNAIRGSLN